MEKQVDHVENPDVKWLEEPKDDFAENAKIAIVHIFHINNLAKYKNKFNKI